MKTRAYLDIETTGFSREYCELVLVGIAVENGGLLEIKQPCGSAITAEVLLEHLSGVDEIYTYNGSRFDLPFIKAKLDIDLEDMFEHRDLMYDCWKNNLRGGLKAVERRLGIQRNLDDMGGYDAIRLWWDYHNNLNMAALNTLLEYNREDIVNLKALREKLKVE